MVLTRRSVSLVALLVVLAVVLGLVLPTSSVRAASTRLTANNDTYVRGGTFSDDNYGLQGVLVVKDGPDSSHLYDRRAYLKFDLSGVSGTVSNATLNLYVQYVQTSDVNIPITLKTTTDAWTEGSLTWNTQPTIGTTLRSTNVTGVGWLQLDVTDFVRQQADGDNAASFVVLDTTTTNLGIDITSAEGGSNEPSLTVTTDTTSEPPLLPPPSVGSNNGPFFQIPCPTTHRSHDDPIVFPGIDEATHQHQFFANRTTNESSTYSSLLAGTTSCSLDPTDKAAYWVPTLYDTNGQLQSPLRVRAYYYAHSNDRSVVQPYPAGLKIIAGDSKATSAQPDGVIRWLCRDRDSQGPELALQSSNPPRCLTSQFLSLMIRFPNCLAKKSDGTPMLDSSDHRRHMAYADADEACPSTHPIRVPKLRLSVTYESPGYSGGTFTLGGSTSSAHHLPWYAMHADFWNSWNQTALTEYVNECLKTGQTDRPAGCNVVRD